MSFISVNQFMLFGFWWVCGPTWSLLQGLSYQFMKNDTVPVQHAPVSVD